MNQSLKRWIMISMLTAMAIVLSIVDSFIPIPIHGVKLGLANVIILIMLYEFKPWEALIVDITRILIVGILRSTLFTPPFLLSLSGGMSSYLIMFVFSRVKKLSPIAVSALGGLTHAAGQIMMAMLILSTGEIVIYFPFIGILSLISGVLSGIVCRIYLKRSITSRFINCNTYKD